MSAVVGPLHVAPGPCGWHMAGVSVSLSTTTRSSERPGPPSTPSPKRSPKEPILYVDATGHRTPLPDVMPGAYLRANERDDWQQAWADRIEDITASPKIAFALGGSAIAPTAPSDATPPDRHEATPDPARPPSA